MFQLRVERGEPAGLVVPLPEGETVIGRSHGVQVRLTTDDVSGKHAKVTVRGDRLTVENLSRYGLEVDDTHLDGASALQSGQRLRLGKTVVLLVEQVAGTAPAAIMATSQGQAAPIRETIVSELTPTPPVAAKPLPPAAPKTPTVAGARVPANARSAADDAEPSTGAEPIMTINTPVGSGAKGGPGKAGTVVKAAAVAAAPLPESDTEHTGSFTMTGGGGAATGASHGTAEGATRAMQTRAASFEELEFLREQELKKSKRRLTYTIVAIGAVVILALVLWPRPPPPETEILWPKDAQGNYLDAFVPAQSGGFKDGGYDLAFPGNPGWKTAPVPGGLSIETVIGREKNIPMHLTLRETVLADQVNRSRETVLQDVLKQMTKEGGNWNFDPPNPVFFLGRDNGIPCLGVSYQREGEGSWYGTIIFFRYGAKVVSLRVEVPSTERIRAENILSTTFLNVARPFERGHWEGQVDQPKMDAGELIRLARMDLERVAPVAWSKIEGMIVGALSKATLASNKEQEEEARKLLLRLRELQSLWYNAQRIAYFDAMAQGDLKRSARIVEQSKAVFPNPDDRRYLTIRKGEW